MAYTAFQFNANALYDPINLVAHGFHVGQCVIYDGSWTLAKADSLAHCAGTMLVSNVPNADSFYVTQVGDIAGLSSTYIDGGVLTPGIQYYLSLSTAGNLTATMPSSAGSVILPCMVFKDSSSGYFCGGSGTAIEAGPLFSWTIVGINTLMAVNNGYMTSSGGTVDLTLPASASIGDVIRVTNLGGNFSIKQLAGQSVNFGNDTTTVGVGGSITSNDVGDTIELVCYNANVGFQVLSSMGNLTYV